MQETQIPQSETVVSSIVTSDKPDILYQIVGGAAENLVDHLLKHRFNDNVAKCEAFLSECSTICKRRGESSVEDMSEKMGNVLHTVDGVSFIVPRAKFQMIIYSKGIALSTNKGEKIFITHEEVEVMISFPKPEDLMLKKKCTPFKMINLSPGVTFKNKEISLVCFPQLLSDDLFQHLRSALNISEEKYIDIQYAQSSSSDCYRSENATYPNMPFLQCHSGVNLGALFPHPKGLLFFKPPHFIPRQYLNSIECGRGTGNTRYIDLTVDVEQYPNAKQWGTVQFTNISREELKPLKLFVANLCAADTCVSTESEEVTEDQQKTNGKRLRDASVNASKRTRKDIMTGNYKEDNEDDSSEDEDEDFKMESSDDDDSSSDTSLDDENCNAEDNDSEQEDEDVINKDNSSDDAADASATESDNDN